MARAGSEGGVGDCISEMRDAVQCASVCFVP